MGERFGARMRQRREAQGISLDTIACETKIKASLLEALEFDDLSQWPGGIFRRAFVRVYAHAIGLDPDATLGEFLAAFPSESETVNGALYPRGQIGAKPALSSGGSTPPPGSAVQSDTSPPPTTAQLSAQKLQAVAELCTAFGRVERVDELEPLVQQAAHVLDAKGVIVWVWDDGRDELRPALVHGYPTAVIARLPAVRRDSDNATAAAFRTAEACAIQGGEQRAAALAVPMLTAGGCAGVFAVEFQHGAEATVTARAVATILAAAVAQLVGGDHLHSARSRETA